MADTPNLSKLYLELAAILPRTTISARELELINALKTCSSLVKDSTDYRIGNPAFEQAHANAQTLLRTYGK